MNLFKSVALIALATAAAMPATAGVLYSNAGPTGPVATPGSFGFSAVSGGGNGALSFTLEGYSSLDGVNYYEDDFTLSLNGAPILQLSYDLGGGGGNAIFTNLYGATVSSRYVTGGHYAIDIALAALPLLAGNNSFDFSYASPNGGALGDPFNGHAGPQGTGDEAWGLSNISLTGGAVPEPASWAMMIGGFAIAGAAMRRRPAAVRFA